jgi:peptidoglycan/LPS O-acetylase OafA/YrhL
MSRTPRIPSLDGLRAVSILFVMSSHAAGTAGFPIHFALDGALGVRIFFIISGYIITRLMLDEEARAGRVSLRSFYRRRFLRILPPLWCYLGTIAVLGALGVFRIYPLSDLVEPLTFTNGLWFWPNRSLWQTVHCWSLTIEENFYLLWPTAFLLLGAPRRRLLLLAMLLLAGPPVRGWIFEHPTRSGLMWTILGQFDMLAWGCFLAVASQQYAGVVRRVTRWRPSVGRMAAVAIIQFSPWYFWRAFVRVCPPMSAMALSMSAQAAAITYLIASLVEVRQGLLYRALNSSIAVRVGLWSYSLYLWQQLFLHGSSAPRWWEKWPTNIFVAILLGIASYHLIEQPMQRLKGPRPGERAGDVIDAACGATSAPAAG